MISFNQSINIALASVAMGGVSAIPAAAPLPIFAAVFLASYVALSAITAVSNLVGLFDNQPEVVIPARRASSRRVRFVEEPQVWTFRNSMSRPFTSVFETLRSPFNTVRTTPTGTVIPDNARHVTRTVSSKRAPAASAPAPSAETRPVTTAAGTEARHVERTVTSTRRAAPAPAAGESSLSGNAIIRRRSAGGHSSVSVTQRGGSSSVRGTQRQENTGSQGGLSGKVIIRKRP